MQRTSSGTITHLTPSQPEIASTGFAAPFGVGVDVFLVRLCHLVVGTRNERLSHFFEINWLVILIAPHRRIGLFDQRSRDSQMRPLENHVFPLVGYSGCRLEEPQLSVAVLFPPAGPLKINIAQSRRRGYLVEHLGAGFVYRIQHACLVWYSARLVDQRGPRLA